MQKLKILNVVGARPNFMKIAPLDNEMRKYEGIEPYLLHTGQHYDHGMSELFFNQLGLPLPNRYLGVGSASHGAQTGKIMIAFEEIVHELQPHLVLVVGDVNSTIACGLVASKMGIKLAHVEAGLRSFDRGMPEEINRVLTDQISDYLFTTEASARANLIREGVAEDRIFFVGNVMIDSLLKHRQQAANRTFVSDLGLQPRGYVLVTLHRPSNVDDREIATGLTDALRVMAERVPVVFPVHPRTRQRIREFGLEDALDNCPGVSLLEPIGYLDFLHCMDNARLVVTDSGGIQEETTVLGVPCVTARQNTERPVTVDQGTNVVVGRDPNRLLDAVDGILKNGSNPAMRPDLWDGHAAARIVDLLWERRGQLIGT